MPFLLVLLLTLNFTLIFCLNTYLQDVTIFCDHSGIWNQLMIDKLQVHK